MKAGTKTSTAARLRRAVHKVRAGGADHAARLVKRSIIDWVTIKKARPPMNERLLLIVSAAGEPPPGELMDTCELAIGYWDGNHFRPITLEPHLSGLTFKVRYWATLRDLPKNAIMQRQF